MADIYKGIVVMENFVGGPGVNVLHFSGGFPASPTEAWADELAANIHAAYSSFAGEYKDDVQIRVPTEFSQIDVATGNVVGVISAPTPLAVIEGTGVSAGASTAMSACARFVTNTWAGGRRLQGRAFIGPLSSGAMSPAGSIWPVATNRISDGFDGLISGAGARLCVYRRPGTVGGSPGMYADVERVVTNSLPSNLRSRRD